jgi:hypothetical protein
MKRRKLIPDLPAKGCRNDLDSIIRTVSNGDLMQYFSARLVLKMV